MIKYQKLDSVFSESKLPKYTPTPEGVAMAHIPGWRILVDPQYSKKGLVRNRVVKDSFFTSNEDSIGSINGELFFNPRDEKKMTIEPHLGLNNESWSVIVVAKPYEKGTAQINSIVAERTGTQNEVVPKIGFDPSVSRFAIYDGNDIRESGARLSYYSDNLKKGVGLYIATFSKREGLSIFHNRELVAQNKNDKRQFTGSFGPNELTLLRGARGEFGYIGVLDVDLSWYEHQSYLKSIQEFLIRKYHIS